MLKIFSVEIEKKTDLPNDKIDLLAFVTHPVPCSRRHMPQPKPRPPSPSLDQNVFTALQPPLFIIRLPVLIVKFGGGIIRETPSEKRFSVEAERCNHCAETNLFFCTIVKQPNLVRPIVQNKNHVFLRTTLTTTKQKQKQPFYCDPKACPASLQLHFLKNQKCLNFHRSQLFTPLFLKLEQADTKGFGWSLCLKIEWVNAKK